MKNLKNDFTIFSEETSERGSDLILQRIHSQIALEKPTLRKVALKIGAAHLLGSFVTLMACSQFGVRLFFEGGDLMHLFMKVSPLLCEAMCGALYFVLSILAARFILTAEEWIQVQKSRTLLIASLALVSLGAFSLVSHEVNFETGLMWFFGAALGGELISVVKNPFIKLRLNSLNK